MGCFGRHAAWALDRYVTEQARHRLADLPDLWLGEKGKGPTTASGIYQMIERRGTAIGVDHLHPHVLRHSWAHLMKTAHVPEEEIMRLAGGVRRRCWPGTVRPSPVNGPASRAAGSPRGRGSSSTPPENPAKANAK